MKVVTRLIFQTCYSSSREISKWSLRSLKPRWLEDTGSWNTIKCCPQICLQAHFNMKHLKTPKASFPLIQHAICWGTDRIFIIKCWFSKWKNDYRIIFYLKREKLCDLPQQLSQNHNLFSIHFFLNVSHFWKISQNCLTPHILIPDRYSDLWVLFSQTHQPVLIASTQAGFMLGF